MKKLIFIFLTVIVTALTSCTQKVNPIHGTPPLNEAYSHRMPAERVNALRQKGDAKELFSFIDRHRRQLTANVVSQHPNVKNHEQIKLILGSGYSDGIQAGDGKTYAGQFNDELIIIINDSLKSDTVFFFGGQKPVSELKFKKKINFGDGEPFTFTIKKNENIDSLIISLKNWGYVINPEIPITDKDGNPTESLTFSKYLMQFKPWFKENDVIDVIRGKIFDSNGEELTISKRQSEQKTTKVKKRK